MFFNQYIEIEKDCIQVPISNSEASMQDRIEEEISDIAFFIVSLQFKNILKKPFYTVFPSQNNVSSERV